MKDPLKRLTKAQKKLLAELSENPGEWYECIGDEYRTAKALQHRGLIEVSEEWGEVKSHDDRFEARVVLVEEGDEQRLEYLTADQLTENGYYWWLPPVFDGKSEDHGFWQIIEWYPKSSCNPSGGFFVGPLKAPVKRK